MTAPGDFEGAMAQAQVRALKEQAQALGLTWSLTIATAVNTTGDQIMAVCDGDSEAIAVTSMIGTPHGGQRVWVMKVPPSGNYVVGLVGSGRIGAQFTRSATAQTIPNGVPTDISYDTESFDTDGFITVPSTTFRIPVGLAGMYAISMRLLLAPGSGGSRNFLEIVPSGGTLAYRQSFDAGEDLSTCTAIGPFTEGQTFVTRLYQTNGTNVDIVADTVITRLGA